ncbi:acyltransferase [Bhargavaea beijingensis]|uniref:Acyltransferase n=1 Tax=Bhargavaea beijingensis TaxID=426756 RepID=A0ABX9ZEH5_9BACL|nr:acyltransferase [Bhargavaea beijingensis]MCW1927557.1 acyltransferase [Bhargavaea beijingensis]RSK34891.1 acyltransferase [Bhargavaea beijingensis]
MRRTDRHPAPVSGTNPLWHMYRTVSFFKVAKNFIVIQIGRYTPFLSVKRWLYRIFLGMDIGEKSALALMVVPDTMFPERIRIGRNSIIGFNTTILAHEYLTDEYRLGDVVIGDNVMIGANTTILPGVEIGDGATVSAASLVNRDIPPGSLAGGNPVRIIYTSEQLNERKRTPRQE